MVYIIMTDVIVKAEVKCETSKPYAYVDENQTEAYIYSCGYRGASVMAFVCKLCAF